MADDEALPALLPGVRLLGTPRRGGAAAALPAGDDDLPESSPVSALPLNSPFRRPRAASPLSFGGRGGAPAEPLLRGVCGEAGVPLDERLEKRRGADGVKRLNGVAMADGVVLGVGAFGKVKLGHDEATGDAVAVKRVSRRALARQRELLVDENGDATPITGLDRLVEEVAVLGAVRGHPGAVTLRRVVEDPREDKVYLVLELAARGPLMKWSVRAGRYEWGAAAGDAVATERDDSDAYSDDDDDGGGGGEEPPAPAEDGAPALPPLDDARRAVREVAEAVAFLHRHRIVHRDIKPDNVLVDAGGRALLSDFGVSRRFPAGHGGMMHNTSGTHSFLSPEACAGRAFNAYEADVWALGVTLHALAFGHLPWTAAGVPQLFRAIREEPLELPRDAPAAADPGLCALLEALLCKDRERRLRTAGDLLAHPWLAP